MAVDMSLGDVIMGKWRAARSSTAGFFRRFIDGDASHASPSNVELVHPFDAFRALYLNLGWVVDWEADLTDEEAQFVRDHAWNFCVTYQGDGRVPIEPPIDQQRKKNQMVKMPQLRSKLNLSLNKEMLLWRLASMNRLYCFTLQQKRRVMAAYIPQLGAVLLQLHPTTARCAMDDEAVLVMAL
ncbi:MAG: hypothetical protein SGPRY_013350 [Prymnesium sp.]